MKLTSDIIKTTINQFKSITSDIDIATHEAGINRVSMRYNVNFRTYAIRNRGVEYYTTNRKKAIDMFYYELYRTN